MTAALLPTSPSVPRRSARAQRAEVSSASAWDAGRVSGSDIAPVRTRAEDRWQSVVAPVGRFSGAMGLVLLLSLAIHLLIVGSALVSNPVDAVAPPLETVVEIVQEAPKAPEPAAPEPPAPAAKQAQVEPAKSELRESEAEQPAEARRPKPATLPEPPPKTDEPDDTLDALKSELEELKAQRDALAAEAAHARSRPAPAPAIATGPGPLPDSFQAVALPMTADVADEAVGYQQIVFSQLAKAKGIGGRQGLPGSAGVRFAVDEAGRLVSVAIVVASGIPSLDAEALAIVRKAAPFPPPPSGAQRTFVANVNFTPLPASPPLR